jgi:hypothetical protein
MPSRAIHDRARNDNGGGSISPLHTLNMQRLSVPLSRRLSISA